MSAAAKERPNEAMTAGDREEILSKVALFADIKDTPQACTALYTLMKERHYKAKETIIAEGDSGSDFFILAHGSASVFKKTPDGDLYKVAILAGHMGTFFGESG